MNDVYELTRATGDELPLLVSVPHTGTFVPDDIAGRFADGPARELPDTDWHLHRLYDFVPGLGGTLLCARANRYVVDLNRPADGHALYPGRDETGIVPTSTFDSDPIYRNGEAPDEREVRARIDRWWRPYHAAIAAELERIRAKFGFALLFDAHSIKSRVPRFFEGELPGLMLGNADGRTCAPERSERVLEVQRLSGLTFRANDPFKGGYITRAYGDPTNDVHALQLEMSQRLYMDEGPPFTWREEFAERLRPTLAACLLAFVGDTRGSS